MGKTSAAVKNRYNSGAYDRINYIVPAGGRAAIQAAAADAGQSVTQYITQAVNARMAAEGKRPIRAYVAAASDASAAERRKQNGGGGNGEQ